jgi:hypothetical protein
LAAGNEAGERLTFTSPANADWRSFTRALSVLDYAAGRPQLRSEASVGEGRPSGT